MTTDRDESGLIRSWLDETYQTERDAQPFLDRMLDDVATTSQRRRRWRLLPTLRRSSAPLTADQTTDYQPTPIPASNGHTPTVTGRTQSMFSPVKAITAGALVFAVGGAFLIAQPFDQQGATVPGAEADTGAAAPVEFTSHYSFSHQPDRGEATPLADGISRVTGETWQFTLVETSDPRFEGTLTYTNTVDRHPGAAIEVGGARIENEGGAWQQVPSFVLNFDRPIGDTMDRAFIGEGEYEGLVAIVKDTWTGSGFEYDGFIIEGELPSAPEPWSAE